MIAELIKTVAGFLVWLGLLFLFWVLVRLFWDALMNLLAEVYDEVEKRRGGR